jgi:hypothetical protein
LIAVILSEKGQRDREILLAGIPRKGETIRLANGRDRSLLVEHVLWLETGKGEAMPEVIIVVRPQDETPDI